MKILIVTGVSGAGKSLVARTLEDLGYFCVDNLPPSLIPKFAEIILQAGRKMNRTALVIDIRGGEFLKDLFPALDLIKQMGLEYEILFLEAADKVLIKRFKESRRSHPLAPKGSLLQGIEEERIKLDEIRGKADHVIDTSNLSALQLKDEIKKIFIKGQKFKGMVISVVSFGFKYGIPLESDLIFDVRYMPNPFYIEELTKLSGKDEPVVEYVMKNDETTQFMKMLTDMLSFLIPRYIKEGKSQLIISIGCTGGRHRSVAIADAVHGFLMAKKYFSVVEHRDLDKDSGRDKP
ncbi:MAG: RNase adapter RapZ [Eubacteriales bacterium]|nr:RNase adapter RapZ [Eubacteriales bacterium]